MNLPSPPGQAPRRAPNPLTAGGWSGLSFVAVNILYFFIYFPLARRLGPEDFGLYAEANLLYGALVLLAEGAVGQSLIQMPGDRMRLARAALWLSGALGALGLVICIAAAPAMVAIYGDRELVPLLALLAPAVLIGALGAVPHALLSRELDFRRKTLPETLSIAAGGAAALASAFAGLGPFSLVALALVSNTVSTVTAWCICRERPGWRPPQIELLRRMAGFTASLGMGDIARYARLNTDYAIAGRLLGTGPLGIYTVAWATSSGPLLFINAFTGRVGYAVYARLQSDRDRVRGVFLSALRIVATAAIPVSLGAVAITPDLVPVALGPGWDAAIAPAAVLFVLQMLRAIAGPGASMILALGHSRLYATISGAALPLTVVAVLAGIRGGVTGLAWGVLAAVGTTSVVYLVTALRMLRIGPGELMRVFALPALLTIVSLPMIMIVRALLDGPVTAPMLVRLVVSAGAGALMALLALRRIWPHIHGDLMRLRDALPDNDGAPST